MELERNLGDGEVEDVENEMLAGGVLTDVPGSGASSLIQNLMKSVTADMSGMEPGFLCLSHSRLHSGDIMPTTIMPR